METVWILLASAAGACIALQAAANGSLRTNLGDPRYAAFFSICGTIVTAVAVMLLLRPAPPAAAAIRAAPWWNWIGGPLGAAHEAHRQQVLMRLDGRALLRRDRFVEAGTFEPAERDRKRAAGGDDSGPLAQLPFAGFGFDDIERRLERRRRPQGHLRPSLDMTREQSADIAAVAGVGRPAKAPRNGHRLHPGSTVSRVSRSLTGRETPPMPMT
ncbi:MAG: DMT family transporter [Alsobacter sp.]